MGINLTLNSWLSKYMLLFTSASHTRTRIHTGNHTKSDNTSKNSNKAAVLSVGAAAATPASLLWRTYHLKHTSLEIPVITKQLKSVKQNVNRRTLQHKICCFFLFSSALWNKCSCEANIAEILSTHAQPDRDTESTLHQPTVALIASSVSFNLSASY